MTKIPPHRVQNLYSERELSIKLLLGKKAKKTTNISPFLATHTYIKLTLVSFFLIFFFLHLSLICIIFILKSGQLRVQAICLFLKLLVKFIKVQVHSSWLDWTEKSLLKVCSLPPLLITLRSFQWGPVLESAEAWRQRLQAPSSFAGSET